MDCPLAWLKAKNKNAKLNNECCDRVVLIIAPEI
jgi:hypothetical protein